MLKSRSIISFDGICPMNCKHCYTYDLTDNKAEKSVTDILDEIKNEDSDIIYISRRYENFYDEAQGLSLVVSAFEAYKKNIFIITRCNLSNWCISQLLELKMKMDELGKKLVVAVSIPAKESYGITEDIKSVPAPDVRCNVLHRLKSVGILTIAMLRPVFPNTIIPVNELINIIDTVYKDVDAIVSSGLAVNNSILERLGFCENQFTYLDGNSQQYLIGTEAKDIKYIDVSDELAELRKHCIKKGVPFFTHSLEALNYII